jgi:hypothetical protein
MDITVYIPNRGWFHYPVNDIEKERAELLAKYPDLASEIIVRPAKQTQYSPEEIQAMEGEE